MAQHPSANPIAQTATNPSRRRFLSQSSSMAAGALLYHSWATMVPGQQDLTPLKKRKSRSDSFR